MERGNNHEHRDERDKYAEFLELARIAQLCS